MTHAPITTIPRKEPFSDQARDRALEALAKQGKVPLGMVMQAIDKYSLHDVNAGQSGNAGGES